MRIHDEPIPEIDRYLQTHTSPLSYYEPAYESTMQSLKLFHEILPGTTGILEIGCGIGMVPRFVAQEWLRMRGLGDQLAVERPWRTSRS